MLGGMRQSFVRWALAVAVLFAPMAAQAQTPESEALARQVAHDVIEAINLDAVFQQALRESSSTVAPMGEFRPAWPKFVLDAMSEELAVSGPAIERIIGRRMATTLTLEELKAGAIIVADPRIKAAFAAMGRGERPATQDCGRDCMRAMRQPAGQGFMRKMQDSEKLFGKESMGDFVAAVMPGFLRRLADKIEAAERQASGN